MSSKQLSREDVMSIARERGFIGFTATAVPCFGLSYVLHLKNATYRSLFAPSAKVGIPLMASMFVGSCLFELAMFDAHRNPENWDPELKKVDAIPRKSTPIHHLLMNRIHDRPFYFATVMAIPLAAYIMHTRMKEPHLTLSQALLQTRVVCRSYPCLFLSSFLHSSDGSIWCPCDRVDHSGGQGLRRFSREIS